MSYENLGKPCRNFCFFASELIDCDPKDGHEKYVLSTFVAGGVGHVIFIDTQTLEGEDIELPGDEGSWALMYLKDHGKLLVGTCGRYGYLHSLDLKTRTWAEPLRLEGQTYIWNLARGKDGNVYGSNYPGCILVKYDPVTHTLSSAGRVGDDPHNMYSRWVFTHPDGNIMVTTGCNTHEIFYYDIDKKTFTKFGVMGDEIKEATKDYIMSLNFDGTYRFYDPYTFELIDEPVDKNVLDFSKIKNPAVLAKLETIKNPPYAELLPGGTAGHMHTLKDGRVIGIKGQDYFIIENNKIKFDRVPVVPPPTALMTLAVDPDGLVWTATGLGQTICWYNPKTKEYWNSSVITPNGGEVYGICPYDGKVFFSTYSGGDHVVYDPREEWNQYDNINPKTLRSVGKRMIRPIGKSHLGPDNNVWTGWSALYGVYGGGISRINTKTYEVDDWYDLIPQQSVGYLAAGKEYMYATTGGTTSGMRAKEDEFYFLRLDMNCNIVWKEKFTLGEFPECLAVVNGYVFMSLRDKNNNISKIKIYKDDTMEEMPSIELGAICDDKEATNVVRALCKYDEKTLLAFIGCEAVLIDAESFQITKRNAIPAPTSVYAVAPDKTVYFAVETTLYSFRFE